MRFPESCLNLPAQPSSLQRAPLGGWAKPSNWSRSRASRCWGEPCASPPRPVFNRSSSYLDLKLDRMRSALEGFRVIVAVNENWRTGMGSSMRCGVEAALRTSPPPEDILLMVCDQVRLTAEVLRRVLHLHGSRKYPITAARYGGRLGVPAIFSSIFFTDLLDVSGDQGARGILERNAERVGSGRFPGGRIGPGHAG